MANDMNSEMTQSPWWRNAVVYQIYPRSFADSTGSGVGDLRGVHDRLDYLAWLGVDAIWLSPFFPSPMYDHGYDVSDYCDVDPVFGALKDFDDLIAHAHALGIRVIIDWVAAHTSSEHPWFQEARRSRDNPKRDWYVWRDPIFGEDGSRQPPNNWISDLTGRGPAWTFDNATGQYYLHTFLPQQADLNWENPEVADAMHNVLRFWIDRGVDGFRADVIHNIGKDPDLKDVSEELAEIPHIVLNDAPQTHPHLRGIRKVVDEAPTVELIDRPGEAGGRMMVGEVYLLSAKQVSAYYGKSDELHLSFNFEAFFAPWKADAFREHIEKVAKHFDPIKAWPTWVLSSHDEARHRTRHWGKGGAPPEAMARAAAVLLLTLRGTPFLYMGEEFGLEDAVVPPEKVVDPGGFRDGCRAPIPWDASELHGWPAQPWLPFPPDADARNAQTMRDDAHSILCLYRRILVARRNSPALQVGDITLLAVPGNVLAYRRETADDARIMLINFDAENVPIDPTSEVGAAIAHRRVELASDSVTPPEQFDGTLMPNQALILR
jgi:alpha-glucosidase